MLALVYFNIFDNQIQEDQGTNQHWCAQLTKKLASALTRYHLTKIIALLMLNPTAKP